MGLSNRRSTNLWSGISRGFAKPVATCIVLPSAILVGACSEVSYTANERPPIAALEGTLKIGGSTQHDVIAALGKPNGKGSIFLPVDAKPREMLSYYFEEGKLTASSGAVYGTAQRTFLWVYFDQDRYDGYMWFTTTLSGGAHP